jgi:hypothetical protein
MTEADELRTARDRVRSLRRENDLLRRLLVECLGARLSGRLAETIRAALATVPSGQRRDEVTGH